MKNINRNSLLSICVALVCAIGMFSCKTSDDELELPRLFRPINLNAELYKTIATITWSKVDSAQSYTVQISTDSIGYSHPVVDTTTTSLSYVKELPGETKFFVRIKANSGDSTKNSQFNSTLSFKTPAENLFTGFGTNNNTGKLISAYMSDVKTLTVKWTPGANVTHLLLTSAGGSLKDSVLISPQEKAAGQKNVQVAELSNWKVRIYNNAVLRGTTYGQVEGDIVLPEGGDLLAALNSATSGQVILLTGTSAYKIGGSTYNFSKNIKVRGLSIANRPVICMTAGTPTTTANMFGVVAGSAIDSLVFENIDFSGYCDNNTSSTKIGYLFNNKTACSVSLFKFDNCKIHNLGNTPFRLSGNTGTVVGVSSQKITNLVVNGCIINETGFASGYGIVNISKSSDYIDNIRILNSTIYNFSYPLISIAQTAATTMNSVVIQNCNFNQTTQNTSSTRVLLSFDFMNIENGISIKNCVFGSSGSMTAGLKLTNSTKSSSSVSGCYFTSDYYDDALVANTAYSLKSKMTSYSGKSTDLWTDPVNGDFKLKDTSFAGKGVAGDLRW